MEEINQRYVKTVTKTKLQLQKMIAATICK